MTFPKSFGATVATVDELPGTDLERRELGQRLRARRLARGLSQQALADRLDEPQPNVTRWESGEMEIPGSRIPDICAALELTLDQFFSAPTDKELAKRLKMGRPPKPPAESDRDEGKKRKRGE
jgi:transcriptional regulator with XRE-family HTH domain